MSFKNIFKKSPSKGPEIIEITKPKNEKPAPSPQVIDFSFNEHRFGHNTETGGYFKIYPVPKTYYGFWDYVTEEISPEEYSMWEDSLKNPDIYIIAAENLGRGFKKYTIKKR